MIAIDQMTPERLRPDSASRAPGRAAAAMDRQRRSFGVRGRGHRAGQHRPHRLSLSTGDPDATSAANSSRVRFKAVAGKVDQAAGIGAAPSRCRQLLRRPRQRARRQCALLSRGERAPRAVEGANCRSPPTRGTARSSRRGRPLTVSYDGKVLFTATDGTFAGAGKGVWDQGGQRARFEQISITVLP